MGASQCRLLRGSTGCERRGTPRRDLGRGLAVRQATFPICLCTARSASSVGAAVSSIQRSGRCSPASCPTSDSRMRACRCISSRPTSSTGSEVTLSSGSTVEALLASAAIPWWSPIRRTGRAPSLRWRGIPATPHSRRRSSWKRSASWCCRRATVCAREAAEWGRGDGASRGHAPDRTPPRSRRETCGESRDRRGAPPCPVESSPL